MSGRKYSEKSPDSSRLSLVGHLQSRALVCKEHLVHNQLTQVLFLWLFFTRCITVSGSCTPTAPQLLGEHQARILLPMTASLATWDFADPPALLALQKYSPDCPLFRFFRIRLFLYLYKEISVPVQFSETRRVPTAHCHVGQDTGAADKHSGFT